MKNNTLIWCVLSVVVTSAVVLGVVFTTEPELQPEQEAHEPDENQVIIDQDDFRYVVGNFEGRLAVFSQGREEPDMVFDVFIHHLPAYDQGQLNQGVYVTDYASLVSLIEDFIS